MMRGKVGDPLDLGLDANLKITSVTGISEFGGNIKMLQARLSDGTSWGPYWPSDDEKIKHPSPSSPPLVLSHLSGNVANRNIILCFHWRPQ